MIYLDTETTGLDPEDRIIQLCYKIDNEPSNTTYFSCPVPIKLEAMATHHITEEMIKDCPPFSAHAHSLQTLMDKHITVAHNAEFDLAVLAKEGVQHSGFICTRKLVEHLYDLPMYKLQYLRYYFKLQLNNTSDIHAHSAEGDVLVLKALYDKIIELNPGLTVKDMQAISEKPRHIRRFAFGKYKGQLLTDVVKKDFEYVKWCLNNMADEDLFYNLRQIIYAST